jgi:hypothetical protein
MKICVRRWRGSAPPSGAADTLVCCCSRRNPENRLVAADLERRWNEKLEALHALEEQLSQIHGEPAPSIQDADRGRLRALGDDLSQAWDSPGVNIETRKKIVRLLISEIIVDVLADKIALIIHWQGGDHTRLEVAKNKAGQTRWTTDIDIVKLVQVLARQMPGAAIAAALNRTRRFTGHGNGWTRAAVCSLRHQHGIAIYRNGEPIPMNNHTTHTFTRSARRPLADG